MLAKPQPPIVCLCGSTRFYEQFMEANYRLTLSGCIVLSVGFFMHRPDTHGPDIGCTPEQKAALDELHLRKIDLADAVYVINVGGYIGKSTRREIWYAKAKGKRVEFLSTPHPTDSEIWLWFKDRHAWEAAAEEATIPVAE